jgi:transposase-like protein
VASSTVRTTYSDEDKARAYVVLAANDGLVKRAARELTMPENTLRRWRDEWQKNGPPVIDEEIQQAVTDYVSGMITARDTAVDVIQLKLNLLKQDPKSAKLAELSTVVGVLDDKISRAKGLDSGKRVDVHHHLPSPDELRSLMGEFISGSISAAEQRAEEIVDAEIVEQAALPAGK